MPSGQAVAAGDLHVIMELCDVLRWNLRFQRPRPLPGVTALGPHYRSTHATTGCNACAERNPYFFFARLIFTPLFAALRRCSAIVFVLAKPAAFCQSAVAAAPWP